MCIFITFLCPMIWFNEHFSSSHYLSSFIFNFISSHLACTHCCHPYLPWLPDRRGLQMGCYFKFCGLPNAWRTRPRAPQEWQICNTKVTLWFCGLLPVWMWCKVKQNAVVFVYLMKWIWSMVDIYFLFFEWLIRFSADYNSWLWNVSER